MMFFCCCFFGCLENFCRNFANCFIPRDYCFAITHQISLSICLLLNLNNKLLCFSTLSLSRFLFCLCRKSRVPALYGSRGCIETTVWQTLRRLGSWRYVACSAIRTTSISRFGSTITRVHCQGES